MTKKTNATRQREKKNTASSGNDVQREGWSAKELSEEASHDDANETKRQIIRGNEKNSGKRDIAGGVDFIETPEGKKERKVTRKHVEKTKTQKNA